MIACPVCDRPGAPCDDPEACAHADAADRTRVKTTIRMGNVEPMERAIAELSELLRQVTAERDAAHAEVRRHAARLLRAECLADAVFAHLCTDHAAIKRAWFLYQTGRDEPVGNMGFRELDTYARHVLSEQEEAADGHHGRDDRASPGCVVRGRVAGDDAAIPLLPDVPDAPGS